MAMMMMRGFSETKGNEKGRLSVANFLPLVRRRWYSRRQMKEKSPLNVVCLLFWPGDGDNESRDTIQSSKNRYSEYPLKKLGRDKSRARCDCTEKGHKGGL